jgi:hypothetical protein
MRLPADGGVRIRGSDDSTGGAAFKSVRGGFIAGAGLTGVALAGLLLLRTARTATSSGPASAGFDSLAVLPLENASRDPNTEHPADGITESLINRLSEIPGIRVLARTTVFPQPLRLNRSTASDASARPRNTSIAGERVGTLAGATGGGVEVAFGVLVGVDVVVAVGVGVG